MIANGKRLFAMQRRSRPEDFLRMFRGGAGSAYGTPEELPEELLHGVELLKRERRSWEAEIPLGTLAAGGLPGARPLRRPFAGLRSGLRLPGAGLSAEREVIEGRGHTVPSTGAPYNERLEAFMGAVDSQDRHAAGPPP